MTDVNAGRMYALDYSPELKSIEEWKLDYVSSRLEEMLKDEDFEPWNLKVCYNVSRLTDEEFIHCFIEKGYYDITKADNYPHDYGIDTLLMKDVV